MDIHELMADIHKQVAAQIIARLEKMDGFCRKEKP